MVKEPEARPQEAPEGLLGPRRPEDALRAELRTCLIRAGLTQAEVARRLGLSQKHVSRMLNGQAAMSLRWADRMARICGRELDITSRPLP